MFFIYVAINAKGGDCWRLLEVWMLMIFLRGSIIDMLLWWYFTFMTEFVIDVNIAVFCGIWQKNSGKIKLVRMTSWVFSLFKVMGDTSKYLVYAVNVGWRNSMVGRSYVSFGDVCSEIEFTKACSGKLVISLSRIDIMWIEVEDMKNICWWWRG